MPSGVAVDRVKAALDRVDRLDGQLGALRAIDPNRSLTEARALDRDRDRTGVTGPLHGMPVVVKDLIDVAGLPSRCGCPALAESPVATSDAAVVAALRAAGAVVIGKSSTHEHGLATPQTFAVGRQRAALARDLAASSAAASLPAATAVPATGGGSEAAVAAGLAEVALTTDTGGSTRIPAAFAGVFGYKPTERLLPRLGVQPLSWTLDHLGLMATSIGDIRLTLEAVLGRALPAPRPGPYRVGVLNGARADQLVDRGHDVVALPDLDIDPLPIQRSILLTEAAYALREVGRERLCAPTILERIITGAATGMTDYLDALERRSALEAELLMLLADVDAIVSPTLPAGADENADDADLLAAATRLCCPANLCGLPAITVPGDTAAAALQVTAAHGDDGTALAVAEAIAEL